MNKRIFFEVVLLSFVLILALVLRLYKLDSPIADWHSWRQADTASVTRVFAQRGVDFFTPRFQDLSSIPSGKPNPNGYRMVELPLYNVLHLSVYQLAPHLGIDQAGRLTSVLISLVSILFIYLIVRKLSSRSMALISALLYSVMPFSVFYSRVVLPEPLMIAFFLISFYLFIQKNHLTFYLSAIFLALALLVKPYAIFFSLPYIYWWWKNRKDSRFSIANLVLFALICTSPLIAWRTWIKQFPEGIPANAWLYNNLGIRLRPAWFRWLFGVRLGNLILGYWGLIPFGLGLLVAKKTDGWIYRLFFVGVIIYFIIFAGGNVQHDYYQAITVPYIAIILAYGIHFLLTNTSYDKLFSLGLAGFSLVMMLFLSWYEIRGYYQINNPAIVEAGKRVDQSLPKDAKVIASYNGDTAFLYQTNRSGWPAINTDLSQMIKGFDDVYYVSVNFDTEANKIMSDPKHQVITKESQLLIVKLNVK